MPDARYAADEHIPGDVVTGLRRVNVDVLTLTEVGRRAAADADQLHWALAEGRVILTHDADYLRLARVTETHAGIAYCHQTKYRLRPGALLRSIQALHAELSAEAWLNRVVFL